MLTSKNVLDNLNSFLTGLKRGHKLEPFIASLVVSYIYLFRIQCDVERNFTLPIRMAITVASTFPHRHQSPTFPNKRSLNCFGSVEKLHSCCSWGLVTVARSKLARLMKLIASMFCCLHHVLTSTSAYVVLAFQCIQAMLLCSCLTVFMNC